MFIHITLAGSKMCVCINASHHIKDANPLALSIFVPWEYINYIIMPVVLDSWENTDPGRPHLPLLSHCINDFLHIIKCHLVAAARFTE